ncbi:MAG: hypothetical protein H6656_14595 [Ardenticatenaceae bacterium]|nr:hypothetical protein [Ardenticatenaceae bacterium]
MSDQPPAKHEGNFNPEDVMFSMISDLRGFANNGLGYSKLFLLEIPLSEDQQREFQKDISRQFEEISRLLNEYQQRLQDGLR